MNEARCINCNGKHESDSNTCPAIIENRKIKQRKIAAQKKFPSYAAVLRNTASGSVNHDKNTNLNQVNESEKNIEINQLKSELKSIKSEMKCMLELIESLKYELKKIRHNTEKREVYCESEYYDSYHSSQSKSTKKSKRESVSTKFQKIEAAKKVSKKRSKGKRRRPKGR